MGSNERERIPDGNDAGAQTAGAEPTQEGMDLPVVTPRSGARLDRTGYTSPDQLRRAADLGELPVYRTRKGRRVFLVSDVIDWIQRRRDAKSRPKRRFPGQGSPDPAPRYAPGLVHQLVTPQEGADLDTTGATSADQLRRAADRGDLPAYRTEDGHRFFREQDVVAWLLQPRRARTNPPVRTDPEPDVTPSAQAGRGDSRGEGDG